MLKQGKNLWLSHLEEDWNPFSALKALGWMAAVLGVLAILGFLLNALKWKGGWKIQFSVLGFWIWVLAGAGGWLFYSASTELLGPTVLWFLVGLGAMFLKLLEKGLEKRHSTSIAGKTLGWIAAVGLITTMCLLFLPGQNFWRSQFYFPPQHAMNLLQTLGEKSILICQDPFEAAACLETRLMEPAAPNSVILEQKNLNQKWYVSQVVTREPGILFSHIPDVSEDSLKTLIRDNSGNWDIHWDLSVLPKGWKEPVGVPTVLTQEFAGNPAVLLEPERFQYRFDLAAMPTEGLTGDEITRNYYARYVMGFDELGKFLMGLGRYSDSIRAFDRSVKLDPSFQEPQDFLAQIYSQKNILEAAQLEFEKIIHIQPEKISQLMAGIEAAQKEKDESKTGLLLDQMIQLNSELANAQYQLSKIYEKEGRAQEAKTLLESSVNMNPQQLGAQIALGHLMKKIGNRIKAQEAFHSALVIDPQNKEAQLEYWKLLNNQ
jgi:tetratricopeptide (TPR) repeat protein